MCALLSITVLLYCVAIHLCNLCAYQHIPINCIFLLLKWRTNLNLILALLPILNLHFVIPALFDIFQYISCFTSFPKYSVCSLFGKTHLLQIPCLRAQTRPIKSILTLILMARQLQHSAFYCPPPLLLLFTGNVQYWLPGLATTKRKPLGN